MIGSFPGSRNQPGLFPLLVAVVVVTGCDPVSTRAPAESYFTVFSSETVLSEEPTIISLSDASVVGSAAKVCLALGAGTPAPHTSQQLRSEVGEFLGETTVTILATTATGEQQELCGPSFRWVADGEFAGENELSACFQPCSGDSLKPGSEVGSVSLSASPTLKVLGAYWESTNAYDVQ